MTAAVLLSLPRMYEAQMELQAPRFSLDQLWFFLGIWEINQETGDFTLSVSLCLCLSNKVENNFFKKNVESGNVKPFLSLAKWILKIKLEEFLLKICFEKLAFKMFCTKINVF